MAGDTYWIHSNLWTSRELLTVILILPGALSRVVNIMSLFSVEGHLLLASNVIFAEIYVHFPDNKDTYNIVKSYRPISLTSAVGKIFERIIYLRLICWLESQFQIVIFQFAYRKNYSTYIKRAFLDNKHTVAALTDLEGAFDSVWRKGVLFKL